MGKKTRRTLIIKGKLDILKAVQDNNNDKKRNITAKFRISQSTLSTIMKNKLKLLACKLSKKLKREKPSEFPELEDSIASGSYSAKNKIYPSEVVGALMMFFML